MTREEVFNKLVEEYDAKALTKAVTFDQHRFISIERDIATGDHYCKGHQSLRGACGYLARTVEEGDPFIPELVLDLDHDERHELDLFAFVAPRHVDGVALLMPRFLALQLRNAVMDNAQLTKLIDKALERRH